MSIQRNTKELNNRIYVYLVRVFDALPEEEDLVQNNINVQLHTGTPYVHLITDVEFGLHEIQILTSQLVAKKLLIRIDHIG